MIISFYYLINIPKVHLKKINNSLELIIICQKLLYNVCEEYVHIPTPSSNGVFSTFVELMNWKWKCVPQKCVPQTAMYDYVSLD